MIFARSNQKESYQRAVAEKPLSEQAYHFFLSAEKSLPGKKSHICGKSAQMQIKITIIKDNGEEVELLRPIGALDSVNILKSVKHEVLDLQRAASPFLTETLIEEHQAHFGENKTLPAHQSGGECV